MFGWAACSFGLVLPPVGDGGRRFCSVAIGVARFLVCSVLSCGAISGALGWNWGGWRAASPVCCRVGLLSLAVVGVAGRAVGAFGPGCWGIAVRPCAGCPACSTLLHLRQRLLFMSFSTIEMVNTGRFDEAALIHPSHIKQYFFSLIPPCRIRVYLFV